MHFAVASARFLPTLPALLFLLMTTMAIAQPQVQLLSAPDRRDHRLPIENRIQSAVSIGTTTCAVWGTTRPGDSGRTVDDLVMQIVRNERLVGAPVTIVSAAARPFGHVSVISSNRSFLVLWNDRRAGAAGVYARALDMEGRLIGEEERISSGTIVGSPASIESNSRTSLIIWNDTTSGSSGVWMLRLGRDGSIDSIWSHSRSLRFTDVMRFRFLPGSLLLFCSDGGGWFIDDEGRFDTRPVFNPGLRPFMLLEDSSVMTVTSGWVEYRTSLFDSTILRSVRHPGLDSALAGSMMFGRDSSGSIAVLYTVMWSSGSKVIRRTRQLSIDSLGEATGQREIASYDYETWLCWGCAEIYMVFKDASSVRGCDNSVLLGTRFETWTTRSESRSISTLFNGVDGNGRFVANAGWGSLCRSIPTAVDVVRTRADTTSRIVLSLSGPVTLEVAVAGSRIPVSDRRPVITISNGEIVSAWISYSDSVRLEGTVWSPRDATLRPLPSAAMKKGSPASIPGTPIANSHAYYSECASVTTFDGGGGFYRTYRRGEQFLIHYNQDHYISTAAAGMQQYRPTATGWRGSEPVRHSGEYVSPLVELDAVASDPESGTMMFAVRSCYNTGQTPVIRSILAFAPDGRQLWRVDSVAAGWTGIALAPIGASQVMVIHGRSFERWGPEGKITEGGMPGADSNARYQSLADETFLSLARVDGRVRIRRFDAGGQRMAERVLDIDIDPRDLFIVQNRSDLTIGIIRPAVDGIRAGFYDRYLRPTSFEDTLLVRRERETGNPTAMFVGDTLTLAWEETHDGSADVFGTFVELPRMVAGVTSEPEAVRSVPSRHQAAPSRPLIYLLGPNPASDQICIGFEIPFRSDVTVEICSMGGSIVRRLDLGTCHAGKHARLLALDGLEAGSFIVRVVSEFGAASSKLVVVPHP